MVIGFIQARTVDPPVETMALGEPLGKGPHSKEDCVPDKAILKTLLTTTRQIRGISETSRAHYNWAPFDEHLLEGTEYFQQQQYVKAYQTLAKGISYIMEQFRAY